MWPGPRSLVTTSRVSFDFLSSCYLDISVRRVCFVLLWIHKKIPHKRWVSPFGDLRIKDYSHLPGAYRSVLRPSSPSNAKASTKCPYNIFIYQHAIIEFRYIQNLIYLDIHTYSRFKTAFVLELSLYNLKIHLSNVFLKKFQIILIFFLITLKTSIFLLTKISGNVGF